MSDYTKKGQSSKRRLTREQRELLINYHNARTNIPTIEEIIKIFNLPIAKQSIQQPAKKRRENAV